MNMPDNLEIYPASYLGISLTVPALVQDMLDTYYLGTLLLLRLWNRCARTNPILAGSLESPWSDNSLGRVCKRAPVAIVTPHDDEADG